MKQFCWMLRCWWIRIRRRNRKGKSLRVYDTRTGYCLTAFEIDLDTVPYADRNRYSVITRLPSVCFKLGLEEARRVDEQVELRDCAAAIKEARIKLPK